MLIERTTMKNSFAWNQRSKSFIAACLIAASATLPAQAADVVKVGKPLAEIVLFGLLDVGKEKGIFKKHDIDIEITIFNGGGAQNQALTAGVVDAALSSGAAMALSAKNAPFTAVAAIMGPPTNIGIITKPDSNIKTADDLKGKKIGVTAATSITALMPRRIAVQKGWGKEGITTVSLGANESMWAAVLSGNIDAMSSGTEWGQPMQAQGKATMPIVYGSLVKDYITHVILARRAMMQERPDVLKRFVAGCLESIAWINANPEEAAKIISAVIRIDEKITLSLIKEQIPGFYPDGKFRKADVDAMIDEYMDQKLFATAPTPDQLYSEAFLPK